MAEDATKVAPHVYKVLFENERLRFLEVTLAPGERTELHSHPDYFAHMLSGGKGKFTTASGETEELEMPDAVSMWREAEQHATENVGETTIHAFFVEPK